jgi:histidine triad (HIT) family protein
VTVAADCLFCRIAAKAVPAALVHEDADVVAFEDIAPQAPVHLLVIPRRHIASAAELGEADGPLLGRMFAVAGRLARECGVAETGFRLVTNAGRDARQSVMHLHLHVLGGRPFGWPPG